MTRKWAALAATLAATALVVGCFSKEAAGIRNRLAVDAADEFRGAYATLEPVVMRDIQRETVMRLSAKEQDYLAVIARATTKQEVAKATADYLNGVEATREAVREWADPLVHALASMRQAPEAVLTINEMADNEIATTIATREAFLDAAEASAMKALEFYVNRANEVPGNLPTATPAPPNPPAPTPVPTATAAPVPGGDNTLLIEAESVSLTPGWRVETAVPGYTGSGYIVWRNGDSYGGPGGVPLRYTFTINESGMYAVQLRGRKDGAAHDTENDSWVRVNGSGWAKHFVDGLSSQGQWRLCLAEPSHGQFVVPTFQLSEGTHTVEIAGRSAGHKIDSITIYPARR